MRQTLLSATQGFLDTLVFGTLGICLIFAIAIPADNSLYHVEGNSVTYNIGIWTVTTDSDNDDVSIDTCEGYCDVEDNVCTLTK